MISKPLIDATNISMFYRTKSPLVKSLFNQARKQKFSPALNDISLKVGEGEIVALLGANGAGKSTFVKILCGIITPSAGRVYILDKAPSKAKEELFYDVGVIFGQKSSLWWDLSLKRNLSLFSALYNVKKSIAEERIAFLTEKFNLTNILDRKIRNLSLGERVKTELVSVLLNNPKILILDEPTIGLDIYSRQEIREYLISYAKLNGAAIILTSHDMGDVEYCAERIALLNEGNLVFDGTIDDLYKFRSEVQIATFKLERIDLEIIKGFLQQVSACGINNLVHSFDLETGHAIQENNAKEVDPQISIEATPHDMQQILRIYSSIRLPATVEIRKPNLDRIIREFLRKLKYNEEYN